MATSPYRHTLLILLLSGGAAAQSLPNAVPMPTPEVQYLDKNGKPLAGSKLCSYAAGTTTPLATYTDSTAGTPNTNPIVLDVNGRASVWVGPALYKFVLRTGGDGTCSTGAVAWSQDNVSDTTLYFANYVKTVGTCTLVTFTASETGGVSRTCSAKLGDIVSVKDFGAVGDGTTNDTAAIQAALNTGYGVDFPAGTYKTVGNLTVVSPTSIRCDSLKGTTIKPASLTGYLFEVSIAGEGFTMTGCNVDMANVGAQGILDFNGQTWPRVENCKFTYPSGGTGIAIHATNTGFMDISHVYMMNPGTGISIQADGGVEDQISHSRIDSAGTVGIIVNRTTSTDVGGLYIDDVQVVNSQNRAGNQSIILTSTATNTGMPTQLSSIVCDNALGGTGLTVTNVAQVSVSNSWITGQTNAIRLEGAGEFRAVGNQNFQSNTYGIAFYGTEISTMITNNKVYGATYAFYVDAGATLSGVQLGNNIVDFGTGWSNNLTAIVHAFVPGSGPPVYGALSTSGMTVLVDDSFSISNNSLKICTIRSGVSHPCKYQTLNDQGNLVFFGDDAGSTYPIASLTVVDPAFNSGKGGISISGGAAITFAQSALVAGVNFGAIGANRCVDAAGISYVGAAVGDTLMVTPPAGFMTAACGAYPYCLMVTGFITAADTITLRGCNVSIAASANTGAQSFRVDLLKH